MTHYRNGLTNRAMVYWQQMEKSDDERDVLLCVAMSHIYATKIVQALNQMEDEYGPSHDNRRSGQRADSGAMGLDRAGHVGSPGESGGSSTDHCPGDPQFFGPGNDNSYAGSDG